MSFVIAPRSLVRRLLYFNCDCLTDIPFMQDTLTPAKLVLTALYMSFDELEPEDVFAHAGVPAARLEDPDGMISSSDTCKLVQAAIELTGDPALGLHLGQEIGIEMLDMVGMMVSNSPYLRGALDIMTRYSPLISTLGRVTIIEDGDLVRVALTLDDELSVMDSPFYAEVCSAAFFGIFRRLLDGDFVLRTLRSRHPAPPWQNEYSDVMGEEVTILFGAGEDSMEFDSTMLDLPMKRHSPGLYQYLRTQAAKRMASLPQTDSTSASVQRLINELLGQQLIDLPLIAEEMGLNPRTLQRRLKEEDTSFKQLLDGCRHQMAREQLLLNEVSIDELAASLGFSEPANFYRAFKSWSGLTPNEFRRQYRGQ